MSVDTTVRVLRVTVENAPAGPGIVFGLQDKSGGVRDGVPGPQGRLTFECDVRVERSAATDQPNFLGLFTHGPPTNRHLYLSHGIAGGASGWIKRIKVPLSPITWKMIDEAGRGALEAAVDGRSAATVRASWRVTVLEG